MSIESNFEDIWDVHDAVGFGETKEAYCGSHDTDSDEQLEFSSSQVKTARWIAFSFSWYEALGGRLSSCIRVQMVLPGMREALGSKRDTWRRRRWPSCAK